MLNIISQSYINIYERKQKNPFCILQFFYGIIFLNPRENLQHLFSLKLPYYVNDFIYLLSIDWFIWVTGIFRPYAQD
jgi:hypothetical protein